MNAVTTVAAVLALLGSALIGGVFFAFSSFVMKALGRIPAADGISAMQSINVVVLNPSFLGTFIGTAVTSLLIAGLVLTAGSSVSAPYYLGGATLYVTGTFLVTALGNVPLNNRLAAARSTDPAAKAVWEHYLSRWTLLNTIRTIAALAAALAYTFGLIQTG